MSDEQGIEPRNTAREKLREELLTDGLEDSLPLAHVESRVVRQHPSAPLTEHQNLTLETIRSLVSDELFELGNPLESGRFRAWDTPLDESIKWISDAYVDHYDDAPGWVFCCWLNLTDRGRQIALALAEKSKDSL
ncbi:MAG: hypothetical protein ACRDU5_14010 [Mycobacterium sp.]